MKLLFLVLLAGVRLILVGFRILVALLVPLMVVKVVAHLAHRLRSRSLVLHRHFCQPRIHVKLDVVSVEDILVVIVYSDVFVSPNTLVIVAGQWLLLRLLGLFELFRDPVSPFCRIVDCLFVGFWVLSRFWWRGLGSHFYEVGREEPKLVRLPDEIAIPPAIVESLMDKYLITL